ncbi:MAG: dephospho-CoA kinase [Gracilibacteraceae bacterium]|jgi:dephospho-CoA kinase|nr:dephospho-CoA kinase [Gracilibacteraceae bacterium]
MYVVGLTGGIGSGKSSVAAWLRERGLDVFDADREIHALYADPALRAQIAGQLGGTGAGPEGVDRRQIAALVFADPAALSRLENILYPALKARWQAARAAAAMRGAPALIYDVPLLYEKGLTADVDAVWVVYATPAQQLERTMARSGLTAVEVEARLAAQMPLAAKVRRADTVIRNDGTWAETEAQLLNLLATLPGGGPMPPRNTDFARNGTP